MTSLRRWVASGVTHGVMRMTQRSPYFTMCGVTLRPKSHRSVRDEGVPTCLWCVDVVMCDLFLGACL